ncbi:MAG: ribosomal protein S18-alanine N-acetyltransferase [Gammaproteobacteria bacterium]|nr:ribosomal protein S18-alanine N-acetyltransferase [Gammaproteobacteria bacterium]
MQADDLYQVIEIERQSYPYPWTQVIFGDCLQAGYSCWVCGRLGVIEAYGIVSVALGESHLLNICVRPESRQQGIGRKLLRHLVSIARRHNAEVMFLEVRPSNTTARALYEDEGFNELGSRRDYYPAGNGREDAIILARVI